MAAKGKATRTNARRSIAELEAELLKRTAERDEALAQQTATAQVLEVINSSPGDLAPVFDAILDKAHSLCGVEYGALFLIDGEQFRAVAVRGYPEKLEQLVRRPYSPEPNSPVRALLHGEALRGRSRTSPAHQAEAPNPRAEVAIAVGIRRVLFVPLRRDNHAAGHDHRRSKRGKARSPISRSHYCRTSPRRR